MQIAIHDANTHVECFLQEMEPCMNLDQPVHQNGPHPPTELCSVKVEGAHALLQLLRQKVYFNVVTEVNLDATSPMVTGVTSQNKLFLPKCHLECIWTGRKEKVGPKG